MAISRTLTALGMICALISIAAAQGVYRYRDAEGKWIYTDRKPSSDVTTELLALKAEPVPPRILVEYFKQDGQVGLRAINECLCTVEFGLRITKTRNAALSANGEIRLTLRPQSQQTMVEITPTSDSPPSVDFNWTYVMGKPGAQHRMAQPYRAPFDIGHSYWVSQAYPARLSHVTLDSIYAVDFAMPDQTPIYAAREGVVVNVAHEHFRGGAKLSMMNEANFIEILHDDETLAMYAHLHWDSIRVRVGQRVQRGQYIANSGNTGFSTGPHLHFVVVRNIGLAAESVPVTFSGMQGEGIAPQTRVKLTAY